MGNKCCGQDESRGGTAEGNMKPADPKQNRMSRKLESTQVSVDTNYVSQASRDVRADSVATDAGF